MLTLLAATALLPFAYQVPSDQPRTYDVKVIMSGFIPVLGGQDGKAEVDMVVDSRGQPPTSEGNLKAQIELREAKFLFNDTEMPFGIEQFTKFFPKTIFTMTPQGKILTNEAKGEQPPVRLPGLDVKRFPDITLAPLEFPADGVEEGKEWTFSRVFNGSDVTYRVKATAVTDSGAELEIDVSQVSDYLQDEGLQIVTAEKDAASRVHAELTGKGVATFDPNLGAVVDADIETTTVSEITDLDSKEKSRKVLTSELAIKLRSGKVQG